MADNFRTFGRDVPARDASPRGSVADPLAELARLIGQSAPRPGQGGGSADRYEDTLPQVDWAAGDDAYAEPAHASHGGYGSQGTHGATRSDGADGRDHGYDDPPPARHYADQDQALDDDRDYGERRPPAFGAEPPRYASSAHEDFADNDRADGDRPHYGAPAPYTRGAARDADYDDHDHEASAPRRSGTILILAVLGLTVLGTAGAFGYRAMFGRSVVAGMPPIIKPAEGPIKVPPSQEAQAGKAGQAEPAAKNGERLVEHQEQPVDVQSANPPTPRIVQTIPVISNAAAAPIPGGQPADFNSAAQQPVALPPAAALPPAPQQAQSPAPAAPGAKQVRTVIIHPGQQGAGNAGPAAPQPAVIHPARAHEPAQRPQRTATAGGPLSIVPGPEGEAQARQPARSRVAMRAPERAEATSAVGGYAVQVTSQRSEAEAEAAYRALQAKYPQELGGHRPLVRRADLGAKGTYYRALVGPFASGEQATELCSKLKAAGGSCIVQRN
jgi:hypothetical protein